VAGTCIERRGMLDHAFLGDVLGRLADRHRVPGAQLAVRHRGGTLAVHIGETVYGAGGDMTLDTAFPLGSVTKAFTATVAMMLVADGDLGLDEPVREHLPELAGLGEQVTVARLLSHTSGLASDPDCDSVDCATSLRRYVLDECRPHNLVQPPGAGFSYSNLGYALVGLLIETITGMRWPEATESILLRPLGVAPAFLDDPPPSRQVATGHSVNVAIGRTMPVRQSPGVAHAPAGGLAASATDLVSLALLHVPPGVPNLLPVADAARMRRPVAGAEPFGLADGWAMGLAAFGSGGSPWFGHDGNGNGTACYFRVNPSSGDAIAFTSNSNTGYHLWQELLDELGGRLDVPIGPHRARVSRRSIPVPASWLGSYVNGDVEYTVTAAAGGHLRLIVDGDVFPGVTCHDDLTFSLPDPASAQVLHGRFVRDQRTGAVDAIQLSGRTARRRTDDPAREVRSRLTA